MPFVWGHAGMGGLAAGDLPVAPLAAPGLGGVPARRGRPLRALRLLLVRTPGPALLADPQLGDLERGEHRHLRAATDPAHYAKLLRASGRVLHAIDPGSKVIVGGLFGRPLQIPPNTASGDFLSRLYRAARREAVLRRRRAAPLRRRRCGDARPDPQPAPDHARPPRRRDADLHDRARLGLRQLRVALGAGPRTARRASSTRRCRCWSATAPRGGSAGSGGSPGPTPTATCQFCDSAGLLTDDREAKPAWYRFNAWTGGDPETVPRAKFDDRRLGRDCPSATG